MLANVPKGHETNACKYLRGGTVGNFVDNDVDSSVSGNTNLGGKVTEINTDDTGHFLMFFYLF